MDGEKDAIASEESKQDEADANDEVDETRADVEPPVTMVHGENAPFRGEHENETDNWADSNDGGANRDDGE